MNTNEAKRIRIEEYLHSLGYNPVRRQGNSLWYKSPFRDEQEPSFKVNTERNLWYDFGAGKGGNIIALARELYASDSLPYLLKRIAEQTPSVRPVSFSFGGQPLSKPSFRQLEVVPLSSPALLSYLRQRGINTELAKRECREVRYLTDGKPYFAVGFPNRSGGYEIRNKLFKGCIAPKDITHIQQDVYKRQVLNYTAELPENKRKILYVDTEQSTYHCAKVAKRILRMAGPVSYTHLYLNWQYWKDCPTKKSEIYWV